MFYVEVYCGHMIVHIHAVSLSSKHITCSVTSTQKGRNATPIWCAIAESVFCHYMHCTLYVRLCRWPHVFASSPCDMNTHNSKCSYLHAGAWDCLLVPQRISYCVSNFCNLCLIWHRQDITARHKISQILFLFCIATRLLVCTELIHGVQLVWHSSDKLSVNLSVSYLREPNRA